MYQNQTYSTKEEQLPILHALPETVLNSASGYTPINIDMIDFYIENPLLLNVQTPGGRDSNRRRGESTAKKDRRLERERIARMNNKRKKSRYWRNQYKNEPK